MSRASVYRIAKESFLGEERWTSRNVGGRPRKLSDRIDRQIIRGIHILLKEEGQFSAIRLMKHAGLDNREVSCRTVRRFLKRKGYHYLQARKKGLMSCVDMRNRVAFAKDMKKNYSLDIWKNGVASLGRERQDFDHTAYWSRTSVCTQLESLHTVPC